MIEIVDNPPPNEHEQQLARQIASMLGFWGPVDRDPVNVAGLLALVREGYTLEGPRAVVSGTVQITPHMLAQPGQLERATEHAWRQWFLELLRQGMRPCGWPAAVETYLAYPISLVSGSGPGLAEIDPDERPWDLLMISVTCEAVPIT